MEAQSDETEQGKQALFKRMAKHLRFDAMQPGYVLLLVCDHPRVIAAGLQATVLRASLNGANSPSRLPKGTYGYKRVGSRYAMPSLRVKGGFGSISRSHKVELSAADVTRVRQGHAVKRTVGLIAGMPWVLTIDRTQTTTAAGGVESRHRLNVRCDSPFTYATGQMTGFYYTCTVAIHDRTQARGVYLGTIQADDIASWTQRDQGNGWILPMAVFEGAYPSALKRLSFTMTVTA